MSHPCHPMRRICGVPDPTKCVKADISSPTTTEEEGCGQTKPLEAGVRISSHLSIVLLFLRCCSSTATVSDMDGPKGSICEKTGCP